MSETPMTVDRVVSAAGRTWSPGEEITSPKALARISDDYLVPMELSPKAQAVADGEGWYNYQTVASVLEGVGDDPARARYALAKELERAEGRQRSTLVDRLQILVEEGEADGEADGEAVDEPYGLGGPVTDVD